VLILPYSARAALHVPQQRFGEALLRLRLLALPQNRNLTYHSSNPKHSIGARPVSKPLAPHQVVCSQVPELNELSHLGICKWPVLVAVPRQIPFNRIVGGHSLKIACPSTPPSTRPQPLYPILL